MAVGVRIVDDPSPSGDGMPVMDVPVFIGFAARGPLQRPVALDSAAAYTAVFGGVLDLVQAGDDPAQRVVAHLPSAVEAFFAAGGRRCHVIRVAGEGATAATFRVPGVRLATRTASGWSVSGDDLLLRANSPGSWADRLSLSARVRSQAVQTGDPLRRGDLLRARRPAAVKPAAPAWACVSQDSPWGSAVLDWRLADGKPARFDPADWLIERVQVDLAVRAPQTPQLRLDACGLAPGAAVLPWFAPDADAAFDQGLPPSNWPLCGNGAAPDVDWMLLPLGVEADFGTWVDADPGVGPALARNGLLTFHEGLFLDPDWTPSLRGPALMRWADDLRFFGPAPRRLQGLHGALGRDDACASDASWVAVPDAVHAGWAATAPLPGRDVVATTTADPVCTCPPVTFDDCRPPPPRVPQVPRLSFVPAAGAVAVLPADTRFTLRLRIAADDRGEPQRLQVQLAGQPDFSDARTVADAVAGPGVDVSLTLPAGAWWLRARAQRTGLTSAWSELAELDVRASGWRALGTTAPAVIDRVNQALLALCAASREHFALLALPADWPVTPVSQHVAALRAEAALIDTATSASAASFAAIHHPWLLQRDADDRLRSHPPTGALMGLFARRSRLHGAWGAPGADPLVTALQLAGELRNEATLEGLGANALVLRPDGVAATRSQTLSVDADWSAIGVRRLFILLRRLCRREGQRFVFEPNDMTLRRGLERTFDALLHRLMQRGAFRGGDATSSYLLKTASGPEAAREIERGECSLLIQVAPSRPLRFLTLHLRRSGEQLTVEER